MCVYKSYYLFIYLAASGLSCDTQNLSLQCADSPAVAGGRSSCGTQALENSGFSSCGTLAKLLHSMWDLSSMTRD